MDRIDQYAVDLTIVIPNLDGDSYLGPCLDSIAASIPAGVDVEVIVVDNGSTDDSELVVKRARVPARWIPLGYNRGFAGAVNEGALAARGRLLALLNNDMVVEPGWITAMLAARGDAIQPRCVASVILDWNGERIDFADGVVNLHGFGDQPGYGVPVTRFAPDPTRPPAFACGGAMLVDRTCFRDAGGFDDGYFAYFEDVDLGWRLQLIGVPVVLAPDARVRHRHHGTSRRMAPEQRTLLLERNALRTLLRNVGDERLHVALTAALGLAVARALDLSGSDRSRYEPFAAPVGAELVPAEAMARLHAIVDLLADLPDLLEQRASIQSRRNVPDDVVTTRLRGGDEAIGATSDEYRPLVAAVARALDLTGYVASTTPTGPVFDRMALGARHRGAAARLRRSRLGGFLRRMRAGRR